MSISERRFEHAVVLDVTGPMTGRKSAGMIDEASDRTTLWNFAVDVAALKAEHQERLRQAAVAAPAGAMIMVEGFASCSGSAALNERLARSRAETAAAFLRAQRSDLPAIPIVDTRKYGSSSGFRSGCASTTV